MTVAIQAALVRIWDNDNQIVGAGFLVTDSHVLTCAHVVSDALGQPRQEMPTGQVQLDFPFVEPRKKVTAVVILWQPKKPDETGDIAGLQLQSPSPIGTRPLRLVATADTWNHPFRAFGFPIRHDQGVWASGVLRDRTVNGHIHIEDTKTPGYSVQPGFSGTAVWDETLQGVIGIVATAESKAETKAAFIIPTDKLIAAWPDLRAWATPPNPYRGLHAFRPEDADLFFGREAFVQVLATAVMQKPFVAVIGASGSGKSSVVFAGLLPKVGRETAVVSFRPGGQPFRALADALLPIWQPDLAGNERLEEARKLAENLQDGKTQLLEIINDILRQSTQWQQLLLVADQFEELYTLCPQKEVRQAFVRCLVTAVQSQTGQHRPAFTLLLTMRADFMGQATAERPLADALQDATYILGSMTREELAAAIEKPAQVASVQFEPGLVTRILDDVGDEPGNLPLLEFALTLLWEQQTNGLLTHAAYEAIGEVEGALAQYAEDQFGGLSQPEQEQARFIFTQLVQPGRGTEDTRRQATLSEIGTENWGLVKWLADARLVVTNRNEVGEETAEIVHEVLTRRWQRLREWVNEDRRFRQWQERLRETVRQWHTVNEDEAVLLRGTLLAEAEIWLAEWNSYIQPPEQAFIEKSVAFRKHAGLVQIRRRNIVLAISLLASVLFAVLGLFSLYNARLAVDREKEAVIQSQIAQSLALAASSLQVKSENSMLALLLAIAAGKKGDTAQAFAALHEALLLLPQPSLTLDQEVLIRDISWNVDKSLVLTWGCAKRSDNHNCTQGVIKVWDTVQWLEKTQFTFETNVLGAMWNYDSRLILSWSDDSIAQIWDVAAGVERMRFTHEHGITGASWNRDNSLVLTWGCVERSNNNICSNGVAKVWESATGAEKLTLNHSREVNGAVWNSDESEILTWGNDNTVRVWDAATGMEKLRLVHEEPIVIVLGAAWNVDESQILTWKQGNVARIWDATTGSVQQQLHHESWVSTARWSRDGNKVLTWSADRIVRVWDVVTGAEELRLPHEVRVTSAIWNEAEDEILTRSRDGFVRVWDVTTGEEKLRLPHNGLLFGAIWNDNESEVLTWSEDNTVRVWDAATGVERLRVSHDGKVNGAAWNVDETQLLTWSSDGMTRVWNATIKAEPLINTPDRWVIDAVWDKDGNRVLTWSFDNTIRVLDVKTGVEQLRVNQKENVWDPSWVGEENEIITWSRDGIARIWEVRTGKEWLRLNNEDSVWGAAWNMDGSQILTWGCERIENDFCIQGVVQVLDSITGNEQMSIKHENWVNGAGWNEDESKLLTWSDDNSARIWDARAGIELLRLNHRGDVWGAAWNNDESQVLTWGCDEVHEQGICILGIVQIWDTANGLERLRLTFEGGVNGAIWNGDESQVLTWQRNGAVTVWNVANAEAQLMLMFTHEDDVNGGAWNRTGSQVLTWSEDNTARIWDIATGVEELRLTHKNGIIGAAWNGNENQVLTWSEDGTASVWNAKTGQFLFHLHGDNTAVVASEWSQDGKQIMLVTQNGMLRIFFSQMVELLMVGCEHTTRNFTWQEWQLYFPRQPYRKICDQWPVHPSVPEGYK